MKKIEISFDESQIKRIVSEEITENRGSSQP
jgi:hypothetical protein